MLEWIGWVATAIFAGSYFCRQPVYLRRLQALATTLWIVYGLVIKAPPVVAANVVVAALALYSSMRDSWFMSGPQQPQKDTKQS